MLDTQHRSRRAILAAALGAATATVARALDRPLAVRAAGDDGSIIHIGDLYADARTQTTLANADNNNRVLWVASNADVGNGAGVAITGFSAKTTGVEGFSLSGFGVYGHSTTSYGVRGVSDSLFGVQGHSTSGIGVGGTSTSSVGVAGASNSGTGVLGSTQSATAYGVEGRNFGGVGILGTGSPGVRGNSEPGVGVHGSTLSGTGVFGTADTGYAIRGSGRVRLDRVSGVATIAARRTLVTINPGVDITPGSFVFLTPLANIGSRGLWFTKNVTTNTITIRISVARTVATRVAWLLLG